MYLATCPPKRVTSAETASRRLSRTSCISSGSSRPESAVEPTRSTNITVRCRRWPRGEGWEPRPAPAGRQRLLGAPRRTGWRWPEQLAAVADRGDAERGQVLGGQLQQDLAVDVVRAESRSYCSRPRPRSQAPMSTRIPRRARGVRRAVPAIFQFSRKIGKNIRCDIKSVWRSHGVMLPLVHCRGEV